MGQGIGGGRPRRFLQHRTFLSPSIERVYNRGGPILSAPWILRCKLQAAAQARSGYGRSGDYIVRLRIPRVALRIPGGRPGLLLVKSAPIQPSDPLRDRARLGIVAERAGLVSRSINIGRQLMGELL